MPLGPLAFASTAADSRQTWLNHSLAVESYTSVPSVSCSFCKLAPLPFPRCQTPNLTFIFRARRSGWQGWSKSSQHSIAVRWDRPTLWEHSFHFDMEEEDLSTWCSGLQQALSARFKITFLGLLIVPSCFLFPAPDKYSTVKYSSQSLLERSSWGRGPGGQARQGNEAAERVSAALASALACAWGQLWGRDSSRPGSSAACTVLKGKRPGAFGTYKLEQPNVPVGNKLHLSKQKCCFRKC